MWVIRCRSVIINPWQNPAAVLYKMTTPQIPPPAFEYNQRTHASPPAWQQLHVDLQTAAAGVLFPVSAGKYILKEIKPMPILE